MENNKERRDSVPRQKRIMALKKNKDSYCWICHKIGKVFPCRLCTRVYHLRCSSLTEAPTRSWVCDECRNVFLSKIRMRASQKDLVRLLLLALKRMRGIDDVSYFDKSTDFDVYPDYTEKIVKPMDLSLLESNVVNKVYKTPEAFLADVKYLLHNCEICNPEQSINAEALVYIATDECAEIDNCPTCYFNFRSMAKCDRFVEPCEDPHLLVWAKMCGYPYWPSKLIKVEESDKVFVTFFGDHKSYVVHVSMIYLYSQDTPTKLKKINKALSLAIQECERHIKKLIAKFGLFQYAPTKTVVKLQDLKEHVKFQLPEINKYKAQVKPSLTPSDYKSVANRMEIDDDFQPDEEEQVEGNMDSLGKRPSSMKSADFDYSQPDQEDQVDEDNKNGVPKRRVSEEIANFNDSQPNQEEQVEGIMNSRGKRCSLKKTVGFCYSQPDQEEKVDEDNKTGVPERRVSEEIANVYYSQTIKKKQVNENLQNSETKRCVSKRAVNVDDFQPDQEKRIPKNNPESEMHFLEKMGNIDNSQLDNKDSQAVRHVSMPERHFPKRMVDVVDSQSNNEKYVDSFTNNTGSEPGRHVIKKSQPDKKEKGSKISQAKRRVPKRIVIVDDSRPDLEKQVGEDYKKSGAERRVFRRNINFDGSQRNQEKQVDKDKNSETKRSIAKKTTNLHGIQSELNRHVAWRAVSISESQLSQERVLVEVCSTNTDFESNRRVSKRTLNVKESHSSQEKQNKECANDNTNAESKNRVFERVAIVDEESDPKMPVVEITTKDSEEVDDRVQEKQIDEDKNYEPRGCSSKIRARFDDSPSNQEELVVADSPTDDTNLELYSSISPKRTMNVSQLNQKQQVDDCTSDYLNSGVKKSVSKRTAKHSPANIEEVAGFSACNSESIRPLSTGAAKVHDSQPHHEDNEHLENKRRAPKRPTNDGEPQPGSSNSKNPRSDSPVISVSPPPQISPDVTPDITPLKPFVEEALGIAPPSEPFRFPGPPSEFSVLSGGSRCRERIALAQNSQTQQTVSKSSIPDSPQEPSCSRTHQTRNESVLGDHFETLLKKLSNEITDGGQAKIFQDSIKSLEVSFQKELDRIMKLKVEEMDLVHEMDKRQLVEATRRECEDEMENILKGIKKKYWCKRCFKEANFHCCDTNYYCSAKCQRYDWSAHFRSCRQRMAVQYRNVHHRNEQNANAESSHAIIFDDPRVPAPRDRRSPTSANSLVLNSKSSATRDRVFANDFPSTSGISKIGNPLTLMDFHVDPGPFTSKKTSSKNYMPGSNENSMSASKSNCTEEVDPLIIPAMSSSSRIQAPVFSRAFAATQASVNGITEVPPARVLLDSPLTFNTLPTTKTNPVFLNTVPATNTSTMLVNSFASQTVTIPAGEKKLYVINTGPQQKMLEKNVQTSAVISNLPSTSNVNFTTVNREVSSSLVNQPPPNSKISLFPKSIRMPDRATSVPRTQILGRIPCFVPVSNPRASADYRSYLMVNPNPVRTPNSSGSDLVLPAPRLVTLPPGTQPQANPLVIPSQALPTTLNNQSTFLILCTPQTPPFPSNNQS